MGETVLITGGQGFFGAHIAKKLLEDGGTPVIFDLKQSDGILQQVLNAEQFAGLRRIYGAFFLLILLYSIMIVFGQFSGKQEG